MRNNRAWMDKASCKGKGDFLILTVAEKRAICRKCVVGQDCIDDALELGDVECWRMVSPETLKRMKGLVRRG